MTTRYERRSHEAPMDFEFTNKDRDVISVDSPFRSPVKRSYTDMTAPAPPFPQPSPSTPTFGANTGWPFLLEQSAPPSTTSNHPWNPKTVPQVAMPEPDDITMRDASPPKLDSPETRALATGAMTRVFRARQKQRDKSRRSRLRRIDPDEDEHDSTDDDQTDHDELGDLVSVSRRRRGLQKSQSEPVTTTSNHNHHYTLHVPTPQLSHSEIPYMLLGYLQFFFNLSLVLGLLYVMYYFLRTVHKDVEQKMLEHTFDSLHEIRACGKLYTDNFCADKPSPIILEQCHEWAACMKRDASIVGRTKLLAEVIGEVINGFMERITWRTLIFTTTSLAMGIAFINTLLMFYRARHAPVDHQSAHPPAPVPSFPTYGANLPYWGQSSTPYTLDGYGKPNDFRRAWSAPDREDNLETPSRRRKLTDIDTMKVQ
ncbi:hypothetical protein K439DRAFT_1639587 [Ramaria rubella]|nr:hypothetical protein K439DRAFT_1639587 [Ramaria rubella]